MAEPLSDRIRRLREARGLTQTALARRSGVTHSAISRIEAGRAPRSVRLDTAVQLARALDVTLDTIAGVDDQER